MKRINYVKCLALLLAAVMLMTAAPGMASASEKQEFKNTPALKAAGSTSGTGGPSRLNDRGYGTGHLIRVNIVKVTLKADGRYAAENVGSRQEYCVDRSSHSSGNHFMPLKWFHPSNNGLSTENWAGWSCYSYWNNRYNGTFTASTSDSFYIDCTIVGKKDIYDAQYNFYLVYREAAPAVNSYSLSYDANTPADGTVTNMPDPNPQTLKTTETSWSPAVSSAVPDCQGYTFKGWNTKRDGSGNTYKAGNQITGIITASSPSLVLYALWEKNTDTEQNLTVEKHVTQIGARNFVSPAEFQAAKDSSGKVYYQLGDTVKWDIVITNPDRSDKTISLGESMCYNDEGGTGNSYVKPGKYTVTGGGIIWTGSSTNANVTIPGGGSVTLTVAYTTNLEDVKDQSRKNAERLFNHVNISNYQINGISASNEADSETVFQKDETSLVPERKGEYQFGVRKEINPIGCTLTSENLPENYSMDYHVVNKAAGIDKTGTLTLSNAAVKKATVIEWTVSDLMIPDYQFDFDGSGKTAADFEDYTTTVTLTEHNYDIAGYTCEVTSLISGELNDTASITASMPVKEWNENGNADTDWHGMRNSYKAAGSQNPDTVTFRIPFQKTVIQEGTQAPGAETFQFNVTIPAFNDIGFNQALLTISGNRIETNGAGTYEGTILVTADRNDAVFLSDGILISEVNSGTGGWKYDDTVWTVIPEAHDDSGVPAAFRFLSDKDSNKEFEFMTFTNSYTKNQGSVIIPVTYTVTYTDGVEDEEVFKDQIYGGLVYGTATPAFQGTPERDGYHFKGWSPVPDNTVRGSVIYIAQWEQEDGNPGQETPGQNGTDKNDPDTNGSGKDSTDPDVTDRDGSGIERPGKTDPAREDAAKDNSGLTGNEKNTEGDHMDKKNPQTGDHDNLLFWILLGGISLLGAVTLHMVYRKKIN
ncbi:InlB B-repeat-containing protein [Anaerolentibacter hominis]|uniref:InlB B-repeat-containing protein n=1 Tax=Anaerolentibacter hominis TaxID=3079009 RepID=UPI0031B7ED36